MIERNPMFILVPSNKLHGLVNSRKAQFIGENDAEKALKSTRVYFSKTTLANGQEHQTYAKAIGEFAMKQFR